MIALHNIQILIFNTHIHIFHNRMPGEAAVALNENFGIKTRYIQNNNGLLIVTPELWRKTKQWHKKYEKY